MFRGHGYGHTRSSNEIQSCSSPNQVGNDKSESESGLRKWTLRDGHEFDLKSMLGNSLDVCPDHKIVFRHLYVSKRWNDFDISSWNLQSEAPRMMVQRFVQLGMHPMSTEELPFPTHVHEVT